MGKLFKTLLLTSTALLLLCCDAHLDVFLVNITIYKRHEWDPPFLVNPPEVYLICNDGMPPLDLGPVDVEHRNYMFRPGDVLATVLDENGPCVKCRLNEDDPAFWEDDTFGDFSLCQHQFTQTGDHVTFVPEQFRMGFQCPDCLVVPDSEPIPEPEIEPEMLPPAPAPDDESEGDLEIENDAASPSIEAVDETDASVGQYYEFTPFSVKEEDDKELALASEESRARNKEESNSSGGLSTATVLSLCFVCLLVGLGVGVLVYRRYSKKVTNDKMYAAVFELTKKGKI